MSALQHLKSVIHQNKELFWTFCQRSSQAKQHWKHEQGKYSGTWRISKNSNQVSMSVQNSSEKVCTCIAELFNDRNSTWSQRISDSDRNQAKERRRISRIWGLFLMGHP